jgi:putative nucleotidyltransferase with HDIG domain
MRPFPAVALRAFHLLGNEDADTRELVATVSPDPVFVANLLQCANSALTGITRQVRTIRHAMTVLGRDRLRGLILTAALKALKGGSGWTPACQNWWRHSVASALLTEGLASATSTHWPAAYSAGLLHDIGRLALLTRLKPNKAAEYESAAATDPAPVVEIEQRMFGETHCSIGAGLLTEWQFPEELTAAAEHHHDADGPWLVAAGCRLATAMGFAAFEGRASEEPSLVLASFAPAVEAGLDDMPPSVMEALHERIESFESLPPAGGKTN